MRILTTWLLLCAAAPATAAPFVPWRAADPAEPGGEAEARAEEPGDAPAEAAEDGAAEDGAAENGAAGDPAEPGAEAADPAEIEDAATAPATQPASQPAGASAALVPLDEPTPPARRRAIVPPFLYYSRRGADFTLATPIGGGAYRQARGKGAALVGPLLWYHRNGFDLRSVFPVAWRWRDEARRARGTVVLPFLVDHHAPGRRSLVAFPFLWHFRFPGHTATTVFPFYSRVRHADGRASDVLFPLYWSLRSPDRRRRVFGPFYLESGRGYAGAGLLPLGIYTRSPRRSLLLGLPLLYRRADFVAGKTTLIAGPFIRTTGPDGWTAALLPLVFARSRGPVSTTVGFPILWHFGDERVRRSTTVALNLYHTRRGTRNTLGFVPLFWQRWDRPGDWRSTTVVPLFHFGRGGDRRRVLTPLFGWSRRGTSRWGYVLPYVFSRGETSADVVFPVFWRLRERAAGRNTTVAGPFVWRTSPGYRLWSVFPALWRWRGVDFSGTLLLPLWADVNDWHARRTTALVPLFLRHRDHTRDTTAWMFSPIFWVRRRPEARDAVLFPVLWHFGGAERATTLFFPVLWDFKRGERRTTILFPLLWRFQRPGGDTAVFLNTYAWRGKGANAGKARYFFIPFFDWERPRAGDLRWEVLGGLFGYGRAGGKRSLRFLYFIDVGLDSPDRSQLGWFGSTPTQAREFR